MIGIRSLDLDGSVGLTCGFSTCRHVNMRRVGSGRSRHSKPGKGVS
jgi:hypothetical protein